MYWVIPYNVICGNCRSLMADRDGNRLKQGKNADTTSKSIIIPRSSSLGRYSVESLYQ
jgi:hypothetical protein